MTEHRSRVATGGTAWIEHYVELGGLRTWYGE